MPIKPNYTDLGFSSTMGPQLRALVEQHLSDDLRHYGFESSVKFDWSESCIEGHDSVYLDGSFENYSGIGVFDINDEAIAEGWMEFICEPSFFLAFWEYLDFYDPKFSKGKSQPGIPPHIWQKIPNDFKPTYEKDRMQITDTTS